MGSTLEDRPVYTTEDCFETFPLPKETPKELDEVGKKFYDFRLSLMEELKVGFTKMYNRFHHPDETNLKILKLREIQKSMDQAVLDAYGWNDLTLEYDFILDYEEEEEEEGSKRKKKKPYRYKFVPELHDEILARLLMLNQERHEEEVRLGTKEK